MIPLVPLLTVAADLARAIVDRLPEPDPELRRMRAEQRLERARVREQHRHELRMVRATRR